MTVSCRRSKQRWWDITCISTTYISHTNSKKVLFDWFFTSLNSAHPHGPHPERVDHRSEPKSGWKFRLHVVLHRDSILRSTRPAWWVLGVTHFQDFKPPLVTEIFWPAGQPIGPCNEANPGWGCNPWAKYNYRTYFDQVQSLPFQIMSTYSIGSVANYLFLGSKICWTNNSPNSIHMQWNLPEWPPLISDHLTKIPIGSSISQTAIILVKLPVHPTSRVVTYRKFHCSIFMIGQENKVKISEAEKVNWGGLFDKIWSVAGCWCDWIWWVVPLDELLVQLRSLHDQTLGLFSICPHLPGPINLNGVF